MENDFSASGELSYDPITEYSYLYELYLAGFSPVEPELPDGLSLREQEFIASFKSFAFFRDVMSDIQNIPEISHWGTR